jgi:hypothetical protein
MGEGNKNIDDRKWQIFFGTPRCRSYLNTPHLQENRSVHARLPLQYNFIILFLLEFIKMYPKKKKKYDKKKVHFGLEIAYHTPYYFSVIGYNKRMVSVYDFYL